MKTQTLKCFHLEEDACVSHWVAAPDEATARGIVVGQVINCDTVEESSAAVWTCEELSPEKARWLVLREDASEPQKINMFEALLAARAPEYLACSEW